MPHHLLYVQDLTAQRQDCLCVAVASLLCRATRRVTLDEEYLALLRVAVRAVGELAWESAAGHRVLALYALASLACCDTRCCCKDYLVAYHLRLLRVLLEIVGESLAYSLLHGTCHLAVAELGLCLTLELWLCYLDRDYGCESFAEVFACDFYLRLLNLLRDSRVVVGVSLQCACEGCAETGEVCTALYGVDVVYVRVDVLRVVGVVHHCHFDRYALLLCLQIDYVVEEVCAVAVYVAHELLKSVLSVEHLFACLALFVGAHVAQSDADAGIEERKLAHTACYDVPLVVGCGEHCRVGPELLACTALVGLAYHFYGVERLALLVFLLVYLSVAEHLRLHACRECVYAAHTHTVQTTADLV